MTVPPKTFRFQRLLNLAEQLADQAKQQLRMVRDKLEAKQDRIQKLIAEMQNTSCPLGGVGSLSALQAWKSGSQYASRLDTLVQAEQELLAKLEDEYQQALATYLQRRRRLKSLELLRDKQETLRQRHEERRQQLEMDDFVLARTEPTTPDNE